MFTKVGLVRAGLAAANVESLTWLGRDLVDEFAVVALAAKLDATVDSESSTQRTVQRAVLDPLHAIDQ